MDTQQLTQHLYDKLIQDGYEYLLLKDVIQKQNTIEIIYEPLKNTPAGTQYSCTSIKDDMVKGLTQNTAGHIKAFIEEPAAA
jgi:hypothetical protein